MKASDIPDQVLLDLIRAQCRSNSEGARDSISGDKYPPWAFLRDLQKAMPDYPAKVVTTKLKSMVKRGLIDGCTCGCRGDFTIL